MRSEQWKPSETPIGCVEVLATDSPSAETVAPLHGSPATPPMLRKRPSGGKKAKLTLAVSEEQVCALHIDALVEVVEARDSGDRCRGAVEVRRTREGICALSL